MEPSKFRRLTIPREKRTRCSASRTRAPPSLFVGLGCPRQEIFAFEFREMLNMPILAVGAAFPFLAGKVPQAPAWMQDAGLEWLFRLVSEPASLAPLCLFESGVFVSDFAAGTPASRFAPEGESPAKELLYG